MQWPSLANPCSPISAGTRGKRSRRGELGTRCDIARGPPDAVLWISRKVAADTAPRIPAPRGTQRAMGWVAERRHGVLMGIVQGEPVPPRAVPGRAQGFR